MRIFLIIAVSIIVLAAAFFLYLYTKIPSFDPKIAKVQLHSHTRSETIFIKKKVWGLTGDHQVIVVSKSPEDNFEPDEKTEYVYKGLSPFFYKFENDTLNLYVMKESKVPNELSTSFVINQIVLENPEMMDLIHSHQKQRLETIE